MSRLFFPRPFTSFHPFSAGPVSAGKLQLSNKTKRSMLKRIVHLIQLGGRQPLLLGGGLWLLVLTWNWSLAVAIASGTIGAIAIYLYQLRRLHVTWFERWSKANSMFSNQMLWQEKIHQASDFLRPRISQLWSQCWRQVNRPLTIALLSGAAMASVVATMALIYRDIHSQSIVFAMGLQFLVVMAMGWSLWGQRDSSATSKTSITTPADESRDGPESLAAHSWQGIAPATESMIHTLDQLWADLISKDTSVRLIAIYRSVNWVQTLQNHPNPNLSKAMDATKLTACFRVMLSHETNPSVQQALREGLMSLQK